MPAHAQSTPTPPADENPLGEFVVTGTIQEHVPKIAVLPSISPSLEDVIVRNVVRRDFQLTGMFDVIDDKRAPPGMYGFDDPVELEPWKKLGAEAVVKVAARDLRLDRIEVFGIAYFPGVSQEPVYEKKIVVGKTEARITAHRVVDALLGALTGRPGGFASQFTFAAKWGRNRRIFRMDSDGHALTPVTDPEWTAISPAWGPTGQLFFPASQKFAPYRLFAFDGKLTRRIELEFKNSIYGVAFNKDHSKMALAVAEDGGRSAIFVGSPDGRNMTKVSKTELATHPVFSPSGKLAWIGGSPDEGTQRLWLDGKAISPRGFTAAAPTFCDTEDGVRVVYSVVVRGNKQDLVMSSEKGGASRLTQNQGSNSYPACSPDGRMLAFFSTRDKKKPGMYVMSLKRWRTQKLAEQQGFSLRWDPLPPARGAAP
jgi:TolB protein